MATVQRANVILDIANEDVEHYMALGYNVIDARGNIIKETMPSDVVTLQAAYREHLKEIESLKAQVETLTSELTAKKSTKASSSKSTKADKSAE